MVRFLAGMPMKSGGAGYNERLRAGYFIEQPAAPPPDPWDIIDDWTSYASGLLPTPPWTNGWIGFSNNAVTVDSAVDRLNANSINSAIQDVRGYARRTFFPDLVTPVPLSSDMRARMTIFSFVGSPYTLNRRGWGPAVKMSTTGGFSNRSHYVWDWTPSGSNPEGFFVLRKVTAGSLTNLFILSPQDPVVGQTLMVDVSPEAGQDRVKVYLDGVEQFSGLTAALPPGQPGMANESAGTGSGPNIINSWTEWRCEIRD